MLDGDATNDVEELARFVEGPEAELTDGVRTHGDTTTGRQLQSEKTEKRAVRHAANHVTVVFPIDPELPLGNLDVTEVRVDLDAESNHAANLSAVTTKETA